MSDTQEIGVSGCLYYLLMKLMQLVTLLLCYAMVYNFTTDIEGALRWVIVLFGGAFLYGSTILLFTIAFGYLSLLIDKVFKD